MEGSEISTVDEQEKKNKAYAILIANITRGVVASLFLE